MAALVEVCINGKYFSHKLEGPYHFKTGPKAGSSVEALMFSNISYLAQLKHIRDSKLLPTSQPDNLHKHLAWILTAGEFVRSTEPCPYCSDEQRNIKTFSVRLSGGACAFSRQYVCCDDEACMYKLLTDEYVHLYPLKFSSLNQFRNTRQREIGVFFKELLLGSGKLDPKKAFDMFLLSSPDAIQL